VVTNRLHKTDGVMVCRATRAEFLAIPDQAVFIQADGEALGQIPAAITAVPDALTLLLPKRYAEGA
jgi:diacylglycerol kinase family enzyme